MTNQGWHPSMPLSVRWRTVTSSFSGCRRRERPRSVRFSPDKTRRGVWVSLAQGPRGCIPACPVRSTQQFSGECTGTMSRNCCGRLSESKVPKHEQDDDDGPDQPDDAIHDALLKRLACRRGESVARQYGRTCLQGYPSPSRRVGTHSHPVTKTSVRYRATPHSMTGGNYTIGTVWSESAARCA